MVFAIHQLLRRCANFGPIKRPNVIYFSAATSLSVVAYSPIARAALELTACVSLADGLVLQAATDVECFSR